MKIFFIGVPQKQIWRIMSKEITKIIQLDEGGNNPKTGLHEQPLWELEFVDGEKRILGKPKMEEYLSKAYINTVHHFKKRISITLSQMRIIQWSIVFTDYQDVLLSSKELCEKLYLGHQRKDEEKYKSIEEKLAKRGLPENQALFHPTSNPYPYLEKERKELDELRARVIEVEQAKNEDENQDIIRGEY